MEHKLNESETILSDDYPVYWDYIYIVDGIIIQSPIQGTVKDLKREYPAKEVRRCDIFGHGKDARLGDIVK